MSYTQSIYHIVFRTKYGQDTIVEEHEKELYAYLYGIVKNKKSFLYRIGGMPNHIHMLVDLHPTIALSDFMKEFKEKSSKWLKLQPNFPDFIGWAEGYAALSKKSSDVETVTNYIEGQKEHHKQCEFPVEYRKLLEDHRVEIDERYFLNDECIKEYQE